MSTDGSTHPTEHGSAGPLPQTPGGATSVGTPDGTQATGTTFPDATGPGTTQGSIGDGTPEAAVR